MSHSRNRPNRLVRLSNASTAAVVVMLLSAGSLAFAAEAGPRVEVENGVLEGQATEGIAAFLGVPFAAPPVGELRWRPPQAAGNWRGIRSATRPGRLCAQDERMLGMHGDVPETGEDCLYLNVWAPEGGAKGEPLPVMFHIHGGSFRAGGGSLPVYNGAKLARRDVVVVSINYRLDRLGLFAHPALSTQQAGEPLANYALMDQVAALRWVNRNIAAFGGDPDNVTLFGCSAGGVSVNYLMTAPMAGGLFHRAIAESGGVRIEGSRRLREQVGYLTALEADGETFAESFSIANDADAVEQLRALTTEQILTYPVKQSSMNPVVDGLVVPESIGHAFRAGHQHPVPYLTGTTSQEESLIAGFPIPPDAIYQDADREALHTAYAEVVEDRRHHVYFRDALFAAPARFLALEHARHGMATFRYRYNYAPPAQDGEPDGAGHCAQVPFVFGNLDSLGNTQPASRDLDVSNQLMDYWVAFARRGNPNVTGQPQWPEVKPERDAVLEIDEQSQVRENPSAKRMEFHQARYEEALSNDGSD